MLTRPIQHKIVKLTFVAIALCSALSASNIEDRRATEPYTRISKIERATNFFGGSTTVLETRDGVKWEIDENRSRHIVQNWQKNDRVTLYPLITRLFLSQDFAMKNNETNAFAFVRVIDGPSYEKGRTIWISDIDIDTKRFAVLTGNGATSYYRVFDGDLREFYNWRINDFVVIGSNRSPDSQMACSYSRICINTRTKQYVRMEVINN